MSVIGPPGDPTRPHGEMRIICARDGWQIWDEVGLYNGPYSSPGEAAAILSQLRDKKMDDGERIEMVR
jgi:hypothetical protein